MPAARANIIARTTSRRMARSDADGTRAHRAKLVGGLFAPTRIGLPVLAPSAEFTP